MNIQYKMEHEMDPMRGTYMEHAAFRDGILYGRYVRDAEHALTSANNVIWTRAQQSAQQWCQL